MPNWTDSKTIINKLHQKWERGDMLTNSNLFPYRINLIKPNSDDMSTYVSEIFPWIEELRSHAKSKLGYGYEIEEKTVHHRTMGKNSIPNCVIVPTLEDAIRLIKKEKEFKQFQESEFKLISKYPILRCWINETPLKVIGICNICDKILNVLDWFIIQNDNPKLYLRQLDIEGIDTKFIEIHKSIISELLQIILPEERVNLNSTTFEERFYLRQKHIQVRFRILDINHFIDKFSDLTVSLDEFKFWNPKIETFFITENEINFLSFPSIKNACVIFGRGYSIDVFKDVTWLKSKKLYYWGDIDTHGFNILSMARSFLPEVQSFLMNEKILLAHESLWSIEEKQFLNPIKNLNFDENTLVNKLQYNHWGRGVRLEQERIKYSYVNDFIKSIIKA